MMIRMFSFLLLLEALLFIGPKLVSSQEQAINFCDMTCVINIYKEFCGNAKCTTGASNYPEVFTLCTETCTSAVSGQVMNRCLRESHPERDDWDAVQISTLQEIISYCNGYDIFLNFDVKPQKIKDVPKEFLKQMYIPAKPEKVEEPKNKKKDKKGKKSKKSKSGRKIPKQVEEKELEEDTDTKENAKNKKSKKKETTETEKESSTIKSGSKRRKSKQENEQRIEIEAEKVGKTTKQTKEKRSKSKAEIEIGETNPKETKSESNSRRKRNHSSSDSKETEKSKQTRSKDKETTETTVEKEITISLPNIDVEAPGSEAAESLEETSETDNIEETLDKDLDNAKDKEAK